MAGKFGWIIAGVFAVGVVVIVTVKLLPSRSAPTAAARKPGFLELMEVKLPLRPIVDFEPTAPGNAGDDYKLAVDLYTANISIIADAIEEEEAIAKGTGVIPLGTLDVIRRIHTHVAAGARKKRMQYVLVHTSPEFEVGYYYEPAATNLQGVSEALELLMNSHSGQKEYTRATEILKNEFVLGWHMINERARVDMVVRGLLIQRKALTGLMTIYFSSRQRDDSARFKPVKKYLDELNRIAGDYEDKQSVVWKLRPNPGDLYVVIEGDEDRAFRVQALLALGVVRYTHRGRSADVRYTDKLLEKYAKSEDRLLAAAAKAAKELTKTELKLVVTR